MNKDNESLTTESEPTPEAPEPKGSWGCAIALFLIGLLAAAATVYFLTR